MIYHKFSKNAASHRLILGKNVNFMLELRMIYFSMDLQITTTTLIDIVNFICIWMGINWPQSGE